MSPEPDRRRLLRLAHAILTELDTCADGFRKTRSEPVDASDHRLQEALLRINAELHEARRELAQAPFIAYLRVREGTGLGEGHGEEVWLISRHYIPDTSPANANCMYVSYLAPLGAVAAQPLGVETAVWVPAGERLITPIERDRFRSVFGAMWDAVDNQIAWTPDFSAQYASLRRIVREHQVEDRERQDSRLLPAPSPKAPAEEVHAQAKDAFPVHVPGAPTKHRELEKPPPRPVVPERPSPAPPPAIIPVITETSKVPLKAVEARALRRVPTISERLTLRDQPLLDEAQDPIFRLPVSAHVVITGAPGTGKTTVLIKRLSQKTKLDFLSEGETADFTQEQLHELLDPRKSWALFTPSDLLRSYLKEALGKERLPATSDTVKTWADEQRVLARDVFGILKVGGKGRFRLTENDLVPCSSADEALQHLAAFRRFYQSRVALELSDVRTVMEAGLKACEDQRQALRDSGVLFYLNDALPLNTRVGRLARLVGGEDPTKLTGTMTSLVKIHEAKAELGPLRKELDGAFKGVLDRLIQTHPELIRLLGGQSRASTVERIVALVDAAPNADSKGGHALDKEWALIRRLVDAAFHPLLDAFRIWRWILRALESVNLGIGQLFADLPELYDQFRSTTIEQSDSEARSASSDRIGPGEVDILLYEMLRQSQEILSARPAFIWSSSGIKVIEAVKEHLRSVVAVDEAPDFSWVQLGCMYRLAHPAWRSFAMCGDVMQRVTKHGLHRWEECRAFLPDLQVEILRFTYRQSRTLVRLAKLMYERSTGELAPFDSPYPEEPEPAPLVVKSDDTYDSCRWIADRIIEIYRISGGLPSIAVFVATEAGIQDVADGLEIWLTDHSITVEACYMGKVLGVGERVRVFAVEHIKGLEFHAVFLNGFDDIYSADQDLGEKYLYLGLTRAAMFLGITLMNDFPEPLAYIGGEFKFTDWSDQPSAKSDT